MLGESIFETQFALGVPPVFAPRYPSYANYRSEAAAPERRNSIGNPIRGADFSTSLEPVPRSIPHNRSDESITRKQENTPLPGYYSRTADIRPRVTELPVRSEIESEKERRQTIGGSPLEGLIAEFRNNSLGDDLRKLKEAHQEIIEELKSAVFKKKTKKKVSRSPERKPMTVGNDRKPLNHQLSNSRPVKEPVLQHQSKLENSGHRRMDNRPEKPSEPINRIYPSTQKVLSQPMMKQFVPQVRVEEPGHRIKTTTVLEVRDHKHHLDLAKKHSYGSQQVPRKEAHIARHEGEPRTQQLREQFEADGFGTLSPKVIDEILGLREIRITLMKQLNQETSNYNRVIFENRQILNENRQLKEQIGERSNTENVPLIQKLTKQNLRLKEKVERLEQELQRSARKGHAEDTGGLSPRNPEHEQAYDNRRIQSELRQYRELYGQLPSAGKQHRRAGNW